MRVAEPVHASANGPAREHQDKPGFVDGKQYTTYVVKVRAMKRGNKFPEVERLLLRLIEATEAESRLMGWGVAPWYYEQLALVNRKQKNYPAEVRVLERFASQRHAPGAKPPRLIQRLEKARALRDAAG